MIKLYDDKHQDVDVDDEGDDDDDDDDDDGGGGVGVVGLLREANEPGKQPVSASYTDLLSPSLFTILMMMIMMTIMMMIMMIMMMITMMMMMRVLEVEGHNQGRPRNN